MRQTGYRGYTTLAKGLPYNGGFCRWYFIAREELQNFPPVDPLTQYLSAEPAINSPWCGPVIVPRDTLGFEEVLKRDKAGLYYNYKVSGYQPGDDRVNWENLPYYEYLVVGKLRAGGVHLLLGNFWHGLQLDSDFKSGGNGSAGSEFQFAGSFLNKALIIPSFQGSNVILPPGSGSGGNGNGNGGNGGGTGGSGTDGGVAAPEIIFYGAADTSVQIPYTAERKAKYGDFPAIEVWYTEEGMLRLSMAAVITIDAAPPNNTLFTITLNAPGPGFVRLG